jgi:hypothetical protein
MPAFLDDCGVGRRVRTPTDILKILLDALGPFGMTAIAVALLVIAVEAVRLLWG